MSARRIIPADVQRERLAQLYAIPRAERTPAERAELANLEARQQQRLYRLPDRIACLERRLAEARTEYTGRPA